MAKFVRSYGSKIKIHQQPVQPTALQGLATGDVWVDTGSAAVKMCTNLTPVLFDAFITNSDVRNTNARTPTGAASGDLTGTFPSPTLASTLLQKFCPTGSILMYGNNIATTGWLLCDGTAVSRITFASLYTIIGTTFGSGNGTTTFNVPDLRQKFPLGKAASGTGSTLGSTGGAIDHAHTITTGTFNVGIVGLIGHATPASTTYTSSASNPPFLTLNFIIKT